MLPGRANARPRQGTPGPASEPSAVHPERIAHPRTLKICIPAQLFRGLSQAVTLGSSDGGSGLTLGCYQIVW